MAGTGRAAGAVPGPTHARSAKMKKADPNR